MKKICAIFLILQILRACSKSHEIEAPHELTIIEAEIPESVVRENDTEIRKLEKEGKKLLKSLPIEIRKSKTDLSNLPSLSGRGFGSNISQPSGYERTTQISFLNDGIHVLTASPSRKDSNIRKWIVISEKEIFGLNIPNKAGTNPNQKSYLRRLNLSNDNNSVFVNHAGAEKLRHWRIADGKLINEYGNKDYPVNNVNLSSDNKTLLLTSLWKQSKLVDLNSRAEKNIGRGFDGNGSFYQYTKSLDKKYGKKKVIFQRSLVVTSSAFSPDSKMLALAYGDGTISIISSTTGDEIKSFKSDRTVRSMNFSFNGKMLAVGTDMKMEFVENSRGRLRPDIIEETSQIILWDVEMGTKTYEIQSHRNATNIIQFSNNGKFLVSASNHDPYIRIWDISNGNEIASILAGYPGVTALAITKDDTKIATPDNKHVLRIHHIKDSDASENSELCIYTICKN